MNEVFDRPGNIELQKAMKHLVMYLAKYGTGVAKQDRARWAIRYGVNRDTAGKYWRQLVDAGAITESNADGRYKKTPYFNELLEHEEEQLEEAEEDRDRAFAERIDKKLKEYADLKAKMRTGPCEHSECPPGSEESCLHCSTYLSLKHKDFLEE